MIVTKKQWVSCGLAVPYYEKPWDASAGDREAWVLVQGYMQHLEERKEEGMGLLLAGNSGTGKTHMVHLVASAILNQAEGNPRTSLSFLTVQGYVDLFARRINASAIMSNKEIADDQSRDDFRLFDERIRNLMTKVPWVILDDVGKEYTTSSGHAEHQIDRLVRARGNRGLPTLMTTNFTVPELEDTLGASFASYAFQVCEVIGVNASDYRKAHHRGR